MRAWVGKIVSDEAPDYVDAMWRIVQQKVPDDFIIATGLTASLKHFVAKAFEYFKLDWQDQVEIDITIFRPSEIQIGRANPEKAFMALGSKYSLNVDNVIDEMCRSELCNVTA